MMVMQLPKRKSIRLPDYDYSNAGAYFITVCTYKRNNLFWDRINSAPQSPSDVPLSRLGSIVERSILEIPKIYPALSVDHYVIMPNHIHLLLQIHTSDDGRQIAAPTVNTVIGHMKRACSMNAGLSLWQKGFYDHIIRTDRDYLDTWNYIDGNPGKLHEDELCAELFP